MLCRKYFDNLEMILCKQIVKREKCISVIVWTLKEAILQGYSGSKNMLQQLPKKCYCPKISRKLESITIYKLTLSLQKNYDLRIYIILPIWTRFIYVWTSLTLFSRLKFPVSLTPHIAFSAVIALMSIIKDHA